MIKMLQGIKIQHLLSQSCWISNTDLQIGVPAWPQLGEEINTNQSKIAITFFQRERNGFSLRQTIEVDKEVADMLAFLT